jgi:GNAT superfamily N-acetyltransferase
MRILTHDEIPDSFDTQVQLLQLGANWGIFDFDQIKRAREMGYPSTDYFAVYAIEEGEIFAKVDTIHIDFETSKGELETMCGISGVLTRRDKSRLGFAKQLLLDVHERERKSGIKYSILWTGRNNKAHNLYESLGYVDIYDPGVALLKTQKHDDKGSNNIDNLAIRVANADNNDAELMEDLHTKINSDRLAFRKRPKHYMKIMFDLQFEKPDSFRIFLCNNTPVGYAHFQQNTGWVRSSEIITQPKYYEAAISLLEAEAKKKKKDNNWIALGFSFISDARSLLAKRGYAFADYTYATLMACDLEQPSTKKAQIDSLLGANDPRLVCHRFDHF